MAGGAHSPKKSGARKAWFWVLGAVILALVIALVVVLLTRDDDDDKPTTTTTTTAPATTTTTAAPTTTSTTVPATTTTVVLPVITDDPQTYAEYLFAAWKLGDRTAAAKVGSADAVDQMFAQVYSPSVTWTFASCGPAAGTLYCNWTASPSGATLTIAVRTTTGGLSTQVVGVTRSS